MSLVVDARPSTLVLVNTTERVNIELSDANGVLVDATELKLQVRDLGDNVLYKDDFFNPPTPPGVTRIVHPSTGKYYFPLGDPTLFPLTPLGPPNRETMNTGRLLMYWTVQGPVGTEVRNVVQTVRIVTGRTLSLIDDFRGLIDKSLKAVSEDPSDPCFLGYTDSMLARYLEGGLNTWNMYEPYPTFNTIDDFPMQYEEGLLEAGLLIGVMSQELFAVDTDIPNYSAQGQAFVIQHQPQLAQYFNKMAQRLDKLIPIAKLKLVRSGSIHTEIGPNFRLQTIISAAPNGALFRNFFLAGS
jgi:hypothetical protein